MSDTVSVVDPLPRAAESGGGPIRVLLGPQRFAITLGHELAALGLSDSHAAAITAGWQEREAEVEELEAEVAGRVDNLSLHARAERVFTADPELFHAHRRKQDILRRLQELYRVRLRALASAARRLMRWDDEPELLLPEVEQMMGSLRDLDAHHTARVTEIESQFEAELDLRRRKSIERHRAELGERLDACGLVLIAGGHVATLLNRIRLFGAQDWLRDRHVVAWSGGAMVLTDRVVLFHDDPSLGRHAAEVLSAGLGIAPGIVVLPHARRRLRLDDRERVQLFAARFYPTPCLTLEAGGRLAQSGDGWLANDEVGRLSRRGDVRSLGRTHPPARGRAE